MRRNFKVAIHFDEGKIHSSSWSIEWQRVCERLKIDYEIVNCYSIDFLTLSQGFDCLLWHFSHYSKNDMKYARLILKSLEMKGLKVFPSVNDCWHFDDKIAQDYVFKSLNISSPNSKILYSFESVKRWLDGKNNFPVVAKLKCGSGSQNVKLLYDAGEVLSYCDVMFNGHGFSTVPRVLYKAKSNILSLRSFGAFWNRFKRIHDFALTIKKARTLDREFGYFYCQEFIECSGYDLKIVVIGEKLSFIGRRIRLGDFRASGGGDLFYDRSLVTQDIIDLCFEASFLLGSFCMGYDVIVDSRSDKPYIVEMSYGFSFEALKAAGGYWDKKGVWHSTPLNVPQDIVESLL